MAVKLEECARILTFLELGQSQRKTAKTIGKSLSTVQRVVQRYLETRSHLRRPGNGRPRCTTARDDRYLVATMLRNRFQTALGSKNHFFRFGGSNLSAQTVRRRLAEANLKPLRLHMAPNWNGNIKLQDRDTCACTNTGHWTIGLG